jgi:hypothetical protein
MQPCGTGALDGGMERADNFKKVILSLFGSSLPDLPVAGNLGSGDQNEGSSSESSNSNPSDETSGSAYYPDYNSIWSLGKCINDGQPPSGRPNYGSLEECCNAAYAGQASGACLGLVAETSSSGETNTDSGESTASTSSTTSAVTTLSSQATTNHNDSSSENDTIAYYPDYNPIWSLGKCISDGPPPSGRPNYNSLEDCCNNAYGGQASGVCLGVASQDSSTETNPDLPETSDPSLWYPDYNPLWSQGKCTNALPLENGRPTYENQLECCQNAYRGQASGICLADVPNQPNSISAVAQSDDGNQVESLTMWYADYNPLWSLGKCVSESPVPDNRPWYYTQSECCEKVYGGQTSGACLEGLELVPIQSAGSLANEFTSYLQSQRYNDLIIYSCDVPEIPQSSTAVDISYEYEYSVPMSIRADLALTDLKRRMMEHVANEFSCQSAVPRKLRRTEGEVIVGFQTSGLGDEIDTQKAHCKEPSEGSFVCVPVIGHLVAFIEHDTAPSEIAQAKTRILKAIAEGRYASESIQKVVYIGEHSKRPLPVQIQQSSETAPRQTWIPVVASLLSIAAVVSLGLLILRKKRRSVKIQEQYDEEEQECSGKTIIDCTARMSMSEYSSPTSSGGELGYDNEDEDSYYESDESFSETSQQEPGGPEDMVEDESENDETTGDMSDQNLNPENTY